MPPAARSDVAGDFLFTDAVFFVILVRIFILLDISPQRRGGAENAFLKS
jgi:hypothetical protein